MSPRSALPVRQRRWYPSHRSPGTTEPDDSLAAWPSPGKSRVISPLASRAGFRWDIDLVYCPERQGFAPTSPRIGGDKQEDDHEMR